MFASRLASRDASKSLGIEWSVRDELEALDACLLVSQLRARDERFQPKFFDLKSLSQTKPKLQRLCEWIDGFQSCERADSEEAWRRAVESCQLPNSVASPELREWCEIALARCCANNGSLIQACEMLKQVLLGNRNQDLAWIERGKVFLEMKAPLLAKMHFTQPKLGVDVELQQRTRDLIAAQQGMGLRERREELEQLVPHSDELLQRAELLLREEFYLSASLYFAACLAKSADYRVQCLLGISACWRAKRDETAAEGCVELCNLAWRMCHTDLERSLVAKERARAWVALRRFAFAMGDLNRAMVASEGDEEVDQLKQRCKQAERASRQFVAQVVISPSDAPPPGRRAHRMFGGLPPRAVQQWSPDLPVTDARFTNPSSNSTGVVLVGPGYVCFPPALDYALGEGEDVLWTWDTIKLALTGMFEAQPTGLANLLLGNAPLSTFVDGENNIVCLPHCLCEYVGERSTVTGLINDVDGLLVGINFKAGRRELNVVETAPIAAAVAMPSRKQWWWLPGLLALSVAVGAWWWTQVV
ncbi:hypothetical protein BASA81_001354 [Batrachochytrium salamandrivorans]|nr:hypothetical protein BASA81_001354 [Batrachochytrium salamandrivorans]